MNRLRAVLQEAARALDALERSWALVGGLAVAVRGEPRMTRDVDLAVAVTGDSDAEALVASLLKRGFRSHEALEQTETGRFATMRLLAPGSAVAGTVVNLLFASSGIESEIVSSASRERLMDGLVAPVAQRGHLMALKVLANRPLDLADFGHLLSYSDPSDLELARAALKLIELRGYHRGDDLLARFEERAKLGPSNA